MLIRPEEVVREQMFPGASDCTILIERLAREACQWEF